MTAAIFPLKSGPRNADYTATTPARAREAGKTRMIYWPGLTPRPDCQTRCARADDLTGRCSAFSKVSFHR